MRLADQWRRVLAELPDDWGEATLDVSVPREEQRGRAAALLGPAAPGRMADRFRLSVHRAAGIGVEGVGRLFRRLDEERIRATLELVTVGERPEPVAATPRVPLGAEWETAREALPPDWSDLLCEVELTSTDHLDRGALLLAPVNPSRVERRAALRFRVAHSFGYGASPEMTARCLARLDAAGIPGSLTILRALSDTDNVGTQGPVWRVGGKAV